MTAELDHHIGHCPDTGKRRYGSRTDAMRALFNTAIGGRGEQRFYRCRHCDGHHLTSEAHDAWADRADMRDSARVRKLAARVAA